MQNYAVSPVTLFMHPVIFNEMLNKYIISVFYLPILFIHASASRIRISAVDFSFTNDESNFV